MNKILEQLEQEEIMDYKKEETYLSKRHQKGWKFKKVTFPGIYTFEKCEPENVIYQLDYNKDGVKHQSEYVRMFEDCGWEYLTEFDGYNYFRKSAEVQNLRLIINAKHAGLPQEIIRERMREIYV